MMNNKRNRQEKGSKVIRARRKLSEQDSDVVLENSRGGVRVARQTDRQKFVANFENEIRKRVQDSWSSG